MEKKVDRDVTGHVQQRRDSDLLRFVTLAPSSSTGPGKLLLVGVRDFADLRPKNRQNPACFLWI